MKFTNVSNPAAFGVEYTDPVTGTMFQLVNARGMHTLLFAMKGAGAERWTPTTSVTDVSRFGMTGPLTKYAELQAIAERFFASHES